MSAIMEKTEVQAILARIDVVDHADRAWNGVLTLVMRTGDWRKLQLDHDGWLSGAELAGVAVWVDRNQNGRSEPGEVISLASAGIVRICVRGSLDGDGVLGNARGIEFSDGRVTPAYDWIAQGVGGPATRSLAPSTD